MQEVRRGETSESGIDAGMAVDDSWYSLCETMRALFRCVFEVWICVELSLFTCVVVALFRADIEGLMKVVGSFMEHSVHPAT